MEECKGSQSSHIKRANAICLENNDQSSTSNFKNAVLLANKAQNPITELLYQCSLVLYNV